MPKHTDFMLLWEPQTAASVNTTEFEVLEQSWDQKQDWLQLFQSFVLNWTKKFHNFLAEIFNLKPVAAAAAPTDEEED